MKKSSTLLAIITITTCSPLFSMERQVSVKDERTLAPADINAERTVLIEELTKNKQTAEEHHKKAISKQSSQARALAWLSGGTTAIGATAALMTKNGAALRRSEASEPSPAAVAIKWGAIGLTTLGTIKIIANTLQARSLRGIVEQQQDQIVEAGRLISELSKNEKLTIKELQALRENVVTNSKAIHQTASALGKLADVVEEEQTKNLPAVEQLPSKWFK